MKHFKFIEGLLISIIGKLFGYIHYVLSATKVFNDLFTKAFFLSNKINICVI